MADRFNLRSRFESGGIFWNASEPAKRFSGHIQRDGRRIELTTAAVPGGIEILLQSVQPRNQATPDVVHGLTAHGACTLIGLTELNGQSFVNTATSEGFMARRYRVSACIFGWHLENDTNIAIVSSWYSYSGLEQWLPEVNRVSYAEDTSSVAYPMVPHSVVDVCAVAKKTRIRLQIASTFQHDFLRRRHEGWSEPRLIIEPAQPQSLQWFFDAAHRFEHFFSLLLGTSTRLRTVCLTATSGETGWVVGLSRGKLQKPDFQACFACDSSQLAGAVANWISSEKFRSLDDLFFGILGSSGLFVETEFLSLAQAIESFHRLTDTTKLIDRSSFKKILKVLCDLITRSCEEPISTRLIEGIRHADEPAFRNRVQSLLNRISDEHMRTLVGDPVLFEETLRQTRNYFTHPGIKKQEHVLVGVEQLFLFNQKLHALMRLLMLLNLGFSEDLVFKPVHHQSRKWTVK